MTNSEQDNRSDNRSDNRRRDKEHEQLRDAWEDQLQDILEKSGINELGKIRPSPVGEVSLAKSNIFSEKFTYEQFCEWQGSELAEKMYPALQLCYIMMYASRAAAIDSGVGVNIANQLFVNAIKYVQDKLIDTALASLTQPRPKHGS